MNFLLNLLDFPPRDLFRKIQGFLDVPKELYTAVDDVVHHLSTSNKKVFNSILLFNITSWKWKSLINKYFYGTQSISFRGC